MSYDLVRATDSRTRRYEFRSISHFNMCGSPASKSDVFGMRLDQSQGRKPRSKRGIAVTVCKCRNCELSYSDPTPVPESIADHYGTPPDAYWGDVSYEPEIDYFSQQINAAKTFSEFRPGMTALDVGFGLGKAVKVMRQEGYDVGGIEPSDSFYANAMAHMNVTNPDAFQCCMIEDAKFADSQFDFITFGAVLEHLYDPAGSIEKAPRWLKPYGLIHIEVPNSRHLVGRILNLGCRLIGTNYVTNLSPMHVPYHLYEFSTSTFEAHGKAAGYHLAHHWVDVASIYNIPRLAHGLLRRLMARNGTGMQLTVFLRKNYGKR